MRSTVVVGLLAWAALGACAGKRDDARTRDAANEDDSDSGPEDDADRDDEGASGGGGPVSASGGAPSPNAVGGALGSGSDTASGAASTGAIGSGGSQDVLGPYPIEASPGTRGGTMTFVNVGAKGSWPRRLDREPGDPDCDYKDGTDTWGGRCCQTQHETTSDRLAPFDEEMTLILKAVVVKQLAVYQPRNEPNASWQRVTAWDERGVSDNLWFTGQGDGSTRFPGDLTQNDCVGYVMQEPLVSCEEEIDYSCPDDPGVLHRGYSGSKLIAFLGSMDVEDSRLSACGSSEPGHPGPWVALVASELVRDGGRKWNGLCNCYSQTGTVGDGCGEINVFEVVMDDNQYSNREFASTGVRSYQEGHVGGAVCQESCERDAFLPLDVDVVDACAGKAYEKGPVIVAGGDTDGCPVWRRPQGDRYFFILLDEETRTIQVGMVHPAAIPESLQALLPAFPSEVSRGAIDQIVDLRLPQGG